MQQTWLTAHSQTLFSKLKVIEKQLLAQTYTSETMSALRKLDDHLIRAQRKLDARDEKVPSSWCAQPRLGTVLHAYCVACAGLIMYSQVLA